MKPISPWKLLSSSIVYQNKWIKVREDRVITPTGNEGIYSVVQTNNSVAVIAVNNQGNIYMHKIFRYPTGLWQWELPGGGADNQDSITAAKRELLEETGLQAAKWHELGKTTVCNGIMTELMSTCLAINLSDTDLKESSDETISGAEYMSLQQIDAHVASGVINDGQSLAALYIYKTWLAKNK